MIQIFNVGAERMLGYASADVVNKITPADISDPLEMVPRLIALNAVGEFDVDGLVTTYPFSDINTAVADVIAGKVVKPVLVW